MKHCSICKVEVDTSQDYCPLCYNHLAEVEPKTTPEMFVMSKKDAPKSKKIMVAKIFLFISFAAILSCVYINIATKTIAWSAVVCLSIVYLWVLVAHTIISRDTPFRKVLFQLLAVAALLNATNQIFSSNDWLTVYVYPSLAMLVTLVLTMITLCSKSRKKYLFSFCSIFVILLVVSVLFIVLKLGDFKLLNTINIMFQCVIIFAYILFGGKPLFSEASRKFHL